VRRAGLLISAVFLVSLAGVRVSVVEGESMAPTIRAGDSVITIGVLAGEPNVGSILLVQSDGRRLLHRLRAVDGDALWLKGDASISGDSRPIHRTDVLGMLALVIPTSHLFRAMRAAARFTAALPLSISLSSGAGAVAEQGPRYTYGADAQGNLLPGAYAIWSILLSACSSGLSSCAANYALRIDPVLFAGMVAPVGSTATSSQALARALRIVTRCQPALGGAWTEASDRFTAEWSEVNSSSGLLALHAGAAALAGLRCEVKVTLLGAPPASGGALTLPLQWGPA